MSGRELDFIKPALIENWTMPMSSDVMTFEKELGTAVSTDNIVALESGTSAIHLALILCGVKPDGEVIVQSMTSSASTNLLLILV